MAILTDKVSVTLSSDVATLMREHAKQRGVSLSAAMRDVVDDLIAEHDLRAVFAELEKREATTQ